MPLREENSIKWGRVFGDTNVDYEGPSGYSQAESVVGTDKDGNDIKNKKFMYALLIDKYGQFMRTINGQESQIRLGQQVVMQDDRGQNSGEFR